MIRSDRNPNFEREIKERILLNMIERTRKLGEKLSSKGFPFTKDFSFHKEPKLNLQNDQKTPLPHTNLSYLYP